MSIEAGTHLGRFEIRSKLGDGGMGEAYARAIHGWVAMRRHASSPDLLLKE